jgi:hypothetical protein
VAFEQIETLVADSNGIAQKALGLKELSAAIRELAEVRQSLELLSKVSGELQRRVSLRQIPERADLFVLRFDGEPNIFNGLARGDVQAECDLARLGPKEHYISVPRTVLDADEHGTG